MNMKKRLEDLKNELALGGMLVLGASGAYGKSGDTTKGFDDTKDKNKQELVETRKEFEKETEDFKEKSRQEFEDFKKLSMDKFKEAAKSLGTSVEKNQKEFADFNNRNSEKAASSVVNANHTANTNGVSNQTEANLDWNTTKEGIRYAITPNDIKLGGNIAVDTYRLMPKMYEVDDNGAGRKVFECGGVYNSNKTGLNMLISERIKRAVISNSIVKDIKSKYGENIPAQAKGLISNTEKSLQALGIVEKNGKYFQTNPDLMRTGGHVKDKNSLAKQKEKDIKESAQYVQNQMNAQQLAYARTMQNQR